MEEELQEYTLQVLKGGEWKHIVKSYEYDGLITAGVMRRTKGDICRVLDRQGNVFWHAEGAPFAEGAEQNG